MKITFEIEIVGKLEHNPDAIATVYYPHDNPSNKIRIIKGLNAVELSMAIHHEIGHVIDYYLGMSEQVEIREQNAEIIGECLRFREGSEK